MSSSLSQFNVPASPSPSDWSFSRQRPHLPKRGKLKNGTFIIPGTGERVRRQITLRRPLLDLPPNGQNDFEGSRYSASSEGNTGRIRKVYDEMIDSTREFGAWLQRPVAKDILKCSLAYTLGSMGTFFPPFAKFLGHQDGKHLVATITVYFHPARSAGSMIEAAMLGVGAFCYAVFISVSSMGVAVFFETQLDMIELGYALILIVLCGGGLGFVGWVKQSYNAPLVSVACSLASLAIITVLTKEEAVQTGVFSDNKIVQVMKMLIMGITSTSLVSLCFWPKSARMELRETMINMSDSLSDMLTLITEGFLSGLEPGLQSTCFNRASSRHESTFTQLPQKLAEAKLEHYALGTERQYKIEASLVTCLQKLGQSIRGLRSAAVTQCDLMRETARTASTVPIEPEGVPVSPLHEDNSETPLSNKSDQSQALTAIAEASEEDTSLEEVLSPIEDLKPRMFKVSTDTSLTSMTMITTPTEIFARFIQLLGPSMKSLAYTLSETLSELPFRRGPKLQIVINEHFMSSLTEALELYSNARRGALDELYRSKELAKSRPESIEADFEQAAASCGHFSSSLQEFTHEMQNYLAILGDLKGEVETSKCCSWYWIRFWQRAKTVNQANYDPEREPLIQVETNTTPNEVRDSTAQRKATQALIIASRKHPSKFGLNKILPMLSILGREDIRFATKVGIGAAFYALFAFIPATRPFYQHWRGEWGLLSYMLVCSMTIGASNTTGSARFIGTFIGAVIAIVVWVMCQGNAFSLVFCGALVSIPCFYLIIAQGKGPFGRFIMLTYNLSCLYAYSLSIKDDDDDDDEGGVTPIITEIVLHRVAAVLAGVIWGLIITRVIWPISARQKFKDGLSLLWLRMSLIWKQDPLSVLTDGAESQKRYMNIGEEFALQRYVLKLDKLQSSATSEFELRGPFPAKAYARIIDSTNKMLDSFHAMNVVIQRNAGAGAGETSLLRYTANERAQLCSRINHLLQALASSMKLEYPLHDVLPGTDNARDRLLAKMFQYRKSTSALGAADHAGEIAKDDDYTILYAYTLVTGQIAQEIKKVEREVDELFGIMDEEMLKLQ